ncbi:MAG: hypothetical protein EOP24_07235 [Hyphomicrobiales bacterium]|nr:MAG: hypothetical protein EOP24_07235 [Hyphomicrobiales bacterium]
MSKLMLAAITAIALGASMIPPALATALPIERDDDVCDDYLGVLKRVTPDDIAGVTEQQRVWVTEYCPGRSVLRTEGNAASVRSAIADNEALAAALRQKGYSAADVFAVKMMGDDTVNLYVHR